MEQALDTTLTVNGQAVTRRIAARMNLVDFLREELGLTGLMAIIVIYTLIVERGLRAALGCRDIFGKLLATGTPDEILHARRIAAWTVKGPDLAGLAARLWR